MTSVYFIVVINNDGSIRKIGFSKNENITIPKIKKLSVNYTLKIQQISLNNEIYKNNKKRY